jgi:P4 family phage/plasmid primase-like protien
LEQQSDGKETKRPINPNSGIVDDWSDPDVWTTFEEAKQAHESGDIDTSGIGFVFTEEDTIAGVDIDDGRDPDSGEPVSEEVAEIVESADSYIEVSQSGTGYHGIIHGFVPDGGTRGDIDETSEIELYDAGRFFATTGDHVEGTPEEINPRAQWLKDLHAEYVADGGEADDTNNSTAPAPPSPGTVDIDKEEVLERASGDDKFQRLWRGDTSMHNNDQSRADSALCYKLVFYTRGDRRLIDSLFRDSGLMRGKWDEVHYSNGDTYGEGTIEEALDKQTEYYTPEPALADGGAATAQSPTTTNSTTGTLTPQELAATAGLTEPTDISDLNDRQKAAYVWQLIKRTDDVHVRVNADTNELWAFDPDTGTWTPDGERALRHAARRAVADINYGGNVLEELKTQVRGDPTVEVDDDAFGLEAGQLAVENGLLDLQKAYDGEADAIRDLKPEDYALNQLPVEYNPEADSDVWYSFVGDVVDSSMIHTMQEYIGDCLHRANRFERALLLVGDGANGKSTFLNTIEAFLGEENTSGVSPLDFKNKQSLLNMRGSLANISVELEGGSLQGKNLTNFKSLTGGDSVEAKRLYHNPFKFTYDGGMLFATNEVPDVSEVSDDDTAFWRRWIIVPFNNHFPEGSPRCDPDLGDRLQRPENLSAVLNWAIEGWGRLTENGGFSNAKKPQAARQQWQNWGDSVDNFLSNIAEYDSDAPHISTSEAHQVYLQWCRENDHDAVGQRKFTNAAKGTGLDYAGSVRTDRSNKPVRGYKSFGTVDGERDPIEVIEADDGEADDTINSGLHQYDDDSDDTEPDNGSSDENGDTEAGEAGNNADDSGGESGENTAPNADHASGDGDGGTWSKLLADISKHYTDGEEIEPEQLPERVDRIDNTTYAQKGVEALADDGLIEKSDGTYRA